MNSLWNTVAWEAGADDVVALGIGVLVDGLEFGGDLLDLLLGVRVADHLTEEHELH